jgi:HK97 family phage prohead protease
MTLEIREAQLAPDAESGTVAGIAVPYDTETRVDDYAERIERGAISDSGEIKLFWQHREVIGRVIETEDRAEGFWIKARISDTQVGRDTLALMRDGVVNKFSIGFVPMEQRDEDGVVVRSRIDLKEVSAVTFPAYASADVTEVREDTNPTKESSAMTEANDLAVNEIRETLEDLERRIALSENTDKSADNAMPEFRSAGELLKGLASGDDLAERAYTGGITGDSGSALRNGNLGDLTRLVDGATTLYSLFSKGNLPDEGNFVEYSVLSSNSVVVTGQTAEGEPLAGPGKLTFTTKTAPVYTRGGYVSLSRQAIERSSINVLNHTLRAQAIALGKDLENVVRQAFNAAVTARAAAAVTVTDGDAWEDWQDALVDAAVKYKEEGITLDALVVSTDVFKRISAIKADDGRPVFEVNGDGTNTIGRLRAKTLTGELLSVPVVLDALGADGKAVFVNEDALRVYTKPAVRLQDENIINLTKDFSVYQYIAVAPELPTGIVPVTVGA